MTRRTLLQLNEQENFDYVFEWFYPELVSTAGLKGEMESLQGAFEAYKVGKR